MKIAIISNLSYDDILFNGTLIKTSLGGPPCYCGLTAREFGFDVELITKFGKDLNQMDLEFLKNKKLFSNDNNNNSIQLNKNTTKFILKIEEERRDLFLKENCEFINVNDIIDKNANGWIISPIYDEIPSQVLEHIINQKDGFKILDPQGFTRTSDQNGHILIKKSMDINIKNIDAVKVDSEELSYLSGGITGLEGMKKIKNVYNLEYVLHSENNLIHFLHENRRYWISLSNIKSEDSTGLGDIMTASFSCALLKEKDPIWAFCFSVGSIVAALKTKKRGIEKIPKRGHIENYASFYYNILKFEDVE
ncbi:MAG: ribokinase [Nitrososphaeraceae archaeon]